MAEIVGNHGGYRSLYSFGFVGLVYHATTTFCQRNYPFSQDPLGKTSGQMIGAARSARQNIVEGSSRAGTSQETELRLYDVAKGSLAELSGDYEAFLFSRQCAPWSLDEPKAIEFLALRLDKFVASNFSDIRHEYGEYFLRQRQRFAPWLEAEDPIVAANAILLAIDQAGRLLHRQITSLSERVVKEGGFSERLTKARLDYRDFQGNLGNDVPSCPKCGKPMRRRNAKHGPNAGKPFWSCSDYPNCNGTRPCRTED